jgi:hypothetical protein
MGGMNNKIDGIDVPLSRFPSEETEYMFLVQYVESVVEVPLLACRHVSRTCVLAS